MTPTSVKSSPDWAVNLRPVFFASAGTPAVYRAAAPDWRAEGLSSPPAEMLWVDLRSPSEYRDLGALPATWKRLVLDVMPRDDRSRDALAQGLLDLASGAVTFAMIYRALLDHAAPLFAQAVTAIATRDTDVVIACTAGRDRTGVLSALLLALAGASHSEIVADYVKTNAAVELLNAQLATGTALDLAVNPQDMLDALAHLEQLGGARQYLLTAGVLPEHLDSFRSSPFEKADLS